MTSFPFTHIHWLFNPLTISIETNNDWFCFELNNFIFRWSHALLFHQSVVDFLRSCILIPLSVSILGCKAIHSCNILETSFLLLVTASTVSLFSESYQLCWVMSWLVLYSYQDTRYKAILVFCMSGAFSPLYMDWKWPCGYSTFLFSDAKVQNCHYL